MPSRQSHIRATTPEIAEVLCEVLPANTIADILNGLLCVEDEEFLTDRQIEIGRRLFDALGKQSPESVKLAQHGRGEW